jgi:predicted  nucleic acid-binding Zn-ribbon protein
MGTRTPCVPCGRGDAHDTPAPPPIVTALARSPHPRDDIDALQARAKELDAQVRDRATDLEAAKADLELFRIRYRQEVGTLHDELDALELAIAEAELGELSKKLEDAAPEDAGPAAAGTDAAPAPARFTSDAVRKLFRDVAKAIHPDLAGDDGARDRRHALMIEANRAYARGDEDHLRWILQAWERSPEAVQGTDPEATRERLERRVAQLDEQLHRIEQELSDLKATPLWDLKAMVDREAARGRDLVADMVRRLQRDIMVATNRRDAMRT